MSFNGIIVGAAVFLIIGICHPLVIKAEYHWGKQSWWIWLVRIPSGTNITRNIAKK